MTEGCLAGAAQGPVYETILCRCPRLDTHRPSTHDAAHPRKPTILQFQSDVRLSVEEGEKSSRNLTSWSRLAPISTDISAFKHRADSSTLTSHSSARASREDSHSRLSPSGEHLLRVQHLPADANTAAGERASRSPSQRAHRRPRTLQQQQNRSPTHGSSPPRQ